MAHINYPKDKRQYGAYDFEGDYSETQKTRITLSKRELFNLLHWVFMDGYEIPLQYRIDHQLFRKLKRSAERIGLGCEFQDLTQPDDIDEEKEDEKRSITDPNGIFFCPKCRIRTNEKNPQTACVLCQTPLRRMGGT